MDFTVKKGFGKYILPQSSMITCWAACAAMLKSYKNGKYLLEKDILKGKYLDMFNKAGGQILPFSEVLNFFRTEMGFVEYFVPLDGKAISVDCWKSIMENGPLIVSAPVMGTRSTHVRVMYGVCGSGEDNNYTQFKVYDPYGLDQADGGRLNYLHILFEHINYQIHEAQIRQGGGVIWGLP